MSGVVVCVGSLHHDVLVRAPRRPEAGETLMGERSWTAFGGKGGNQAVAAARAGARSRMAGAVGDDAAGGTLLRHLDEAGVDRRHVRTLAGASGMSVAILDPSGDYGAVVVSNANGRLDPAWLDAPALWEGAAVAMLQNELPEAANLRAATLARGRGVLTVLNAAPFRPLPEALAPLVGVLVVNAGEAEALGGGPVRSGGDALRAAGALARRFAAVVVTAGPEGAALAQEGGSLRLPAARVEVASAHGAGDVLVGSLSAGLAAGRPLPDALRRAVDAAGRHVAGERGDDPRG